MVVLNSQNTAWALGVWANHMSFHKYVYLSDSETELWTNWTWTFVFLQGVTVAAWDSVASASKPFWASDSSSEEQTVTSGMMWNHTQWYLQVYPSIYWNIPSILSYTMLWYIPVYPAIYLNIPVHIFSKIIYWYVLVYVLSKMLKSIFKYVLVYTFSRYITVYSSIWQYIWMYT